MTGTILSNEEKKAPRDAHILILGIREYVMYGTWQREMKVADRVKVANQLNLRLSWIVQVDPMSMLGS